VGFHLNSAVSGRKISLLARLGYKPIIQIYTTSYMEKKKRPRKKIT